MPAPYPAPAGTMPAPSVRLNSRTLVTTAAVAGIHVALLAVVMSMRHEPEVRPIESHEMTAELLSPAPVAAPVALQSIAPPPPKPTPPVPHVKPKVQPRPTPVAKSTPAPLPEA
ncbi:MAG: energy transducer TonB, partial [Paraburkholderia sp.]